MGSEDCCDETMMGLELRKAEKYVVMVTDIHGVHIKNVIESVSIITLKFQF